MRKDDFQNCTQLKQLMTFIVFRTLSEVTLLKFGGLTSDKRIFGAGVRSNFLSGRLKNWNNNVKKQNKQEPEFNLETVWQKIFGQAFF